jgi:L,D-transpeptidase YcbB
MNEQVSRNIKDVLQYAVENSGKINDSLKLAYPTLVDTFYRSIDYQNIWNKAGQWLPMADSLYNFIEYSNYFGLYPSDYNFFAIRHLRNKLAVDSMARKDAVLWTNLDLLLTDGFMKVSQHLKFGRLGRDSLYPKADSLISNFLAVNTLKNVVTTNQLVPVLNTLEPKLKGYDSLKLAIPFFLDSIDRKIYIKINYPDKDSVALIKALKTRLAEEHFIKPADNALPDSVGLSKAIIRAQKTKKMYIDGKISAPLIRRLNMNWSDYFKKIAFNLDRYKRLPDPMPERYIWVNLPGYYLKVYDHDTIYLESRIVCGKPETPTPQLNGSISNMVTYPQWTMPASIVKKDILPAAKQDPGYFKRKGFSVVDSKGNEVDPYKVKWKKYKEDIPYNIVQGSGDDNALGVFKFNFYSPFDIYLHDTNQRYFFKYNTRSLSHGCVRVQEWEKLAAYISMNDSLANKTARPVPYNMDSIHNWLAAKAKKTIYVRNRLPLFLRYITADAFNGKISFYDDVYGIDKKITDKYFRGK